MSTIGHHVTTTRALYLLGALPAVLLALADRARALDCSNPITTADMVTCASRDFDEADKALNASYTSAMALMRKRAPDLPKAADRLRDAQRAWLAYRDANCGWAAGAVDGGSMEPLVSLGCKTTMTRARTAELKDVAKTYE